MSSLVLQQVQSEIELQETALNKQTIRRWSQFLKDLECLVRYSWEGEGMVNVICMYETVAMILLTFPNNKRSLHCISMRSESHIKKKQV